MAEDQPSTAKFGDSTEDNRLSALVDAWMFGWEKAKSDDKSRAFLALIREKKLLTDRITVNGQETTLLITLLSNRYVDNYNCGKQVFELMQKTLPPEELAKALAYKDASGNDAATIAFRRGDYAFFEEIITWMPPGTTLERYASLLDSVHSEKGLKALQKAFGQDNVDKALRASIAERADELSSYSPNRANTYMAKLDAQLPAQELDEEKRRSLREQIFKKERSVFLEQVSILHKIDPEALKRVLSRPVGANISVLLAQCIDDRCLMADWLSTRNDMQHVPELKRLVDLVHLQYDLRKDGFIKEPGMPSAMPFAARTRIHESLVYGSNSPEVRAWAIELIELEWPKSTLDIRTKIIETYCSSPEVFKHLYTKHPNDVLAFAKDSNNRDRIALLGHCAAGTPADEAFFLELLSKLPDEAKVEVLRRMLQPNFHPQDTSETENSKFSKIQQKLALVQRAIGVADHPSLCTTGANRSLFREMVMDQVEYFDAGEPQKRQQFLTIYRYALEKGFFTEIDLKEQWDKPYGDKKPLTIAEIFADKRNELIKKQAKAVQECEKYIADNRNNIDPKILASYRKKVETAAGRVELLDEMEKEFNATAARREELRKKFKLDQPPGGAAPGPAIPSGGMKADARQNGAVLANSGVTCSGESSLPGSSAVPRQNDSPTLAL